MSAVPVTTAPLRSVDEAIASLLRRARPVIETEWLPVHRALGRVLAEDLQATGDSPPFDNSAVDGFAFAARDMRRALETGLTVDGRYAAGSGPGALPPGCAARIFTGACLPDGANRVAMQEDCIVEDGKVRILKTLSANENIRRRGEDILAGDFALHQGLRLRPQDLGVAAALGHPRLKVYRRLRVAVLSTGDELVAPGESLRPGAIHDANGALIAGLLHAQGCEATLAGTVADDPEQTVDALLRAAAFADAVITSGGASVGEEDHVRDAIARCGRLDWWKVAVKPGKPVAFGRVAETPLLGLPGNPVSAFVTFCVFVRPFLRRMQGVEEVVPAGIPVPARFSRPPGTRREYLRVRLENGGGEPGLVLCGAQGSGRLMSAVRAHGLAAVPEGRGVRAGESLAYYPFETLLS